ncbi:MAG: 4'-phosphopantetheinyl transferase superfamily protein [Pirellulales bacterium]
MKQITPMTRLMPGVVRVLTMRIAGDDRSDEAELSADERRRAAALATRLDRHRFVIRRVALRRLVGHCCGMPAADVRFQYSPAGKPALTGGPAGFAFSVSHSHGVLLMAVAIAGERKKTLRLGVDVERLEPGIDAPGLAEAVFADEECAALQCCDGEDQVALFYRIWTCREAVAKALGAGLRIEPNCLCINATCGGPAEVLRDGDRRPGDWALRDIAIPQDASGGSGAPGGEAPKFRAVLAVDDSSAAVEQYSCVGLAGLAELLAG